MIETLNQQISPTQKPIFLHTISNNDWSIDFNFLLLHTQKKTKKHTLDERKNGYQRSQQHNMVDVKRLK